MRRIIFPLLVCLLVQITLKAQSVPEWNAAEIKLQLEKLDVLGSVLYVAAHPDDENTRLLAYLSNGKKYRTAYLSLTRGDGGQNLVGDEQGSYLGLMRTEELLAARKIDGAEQFFSHANDFGFSKSADETFGFWGHERILADVVWRIRKFRPDIIICRFPEDKRAGHGHHWASAILAHEGFIAAADPTKFPEQLKYVKPWQAKRILWNTFNFGGNNTTSPEQLKINVGGYNALLGEGYGELAALSRSMHKTQGFGVSKSYGQSYEYFTNIAGPAAQDSLMDGVNTTWSRVAGGKEIETQINEALQQYDMDHPEKIVPLLLKIRSAIQHIPDSYWRSLKEKQVDQLILACCGIWLNAYSNNPYVVAGQSINVKTEIINRSGISVTLERISLPGENINISKKLTDNILEQKEYSVKIPDSTSISQPYWLVEEHPVGYYRFSDPRLAGLPENPPAVTAVFTLQIGGQSLTVQGEVMYKYTDPVRGEVQGPLVVTPPVTANLANEVYVFTQPQSQTIPVKLKSYKDDVSGVAHVAVPDNFTVSQNDIPFSLQKSGDEKTILFTLTPKHPIDTASSEALGVSLKIDNKEYKRGIKIIAPGYIPTITVFPLAETKLVSVPLNTSGSNIGYIMGAGDKVPEALRQMGYQVKLIDVNAPLNNLKQFNAIVIGIRAYNTEKALKNAQQSLMDYVKNGGTLVVQYNKNFDLVTGDLGPYPFKVSRDRVTEEDAKVDFLLPADPVLQVPNKITSKDFDGWIQERGVYFVSDADPHYRQPLGMHDKGEQMLKGALIICDYGKGKYVYTGLDFFRELPAGIPGAFRLFANLIAKK